MENKPVSSFNRNKRIRIFLIWCFLIFTPARTLVAQKYFSGRNEFGIVAGVSNYYGDLSQGQNIKHFHPSVGIYQKYNLNNYFSFRNQLSALTISGTTDGNRDYEYQNLNFKTDIYEFSSMLNFDFHKFGTNVNNGNKTPYFLIGLSFFRFDPKRLENEDINLRTINTEMRPASYNQMQLAIPIGIGYKFRSVPRRHKGAWIFGVEAIWRKTYVDYLDDVNNVYPDYKAISDKQGNGSAQYSQAQTLNGLSKLKSGTFRGDTHLKDWYYFYGINLSYRFTPFICR